MVQHFHLSVVSGYYVKCEWKEAVLSLSTLCKFPVKIMSELHFSMSAVILMQLFFHIEVILFAWSQSLEHASFFLDNDVLGISSLEVILEPWVMMWRGDCFVCIKSPCKKPLIEKWIFLTRLSPSLEKVGLTSPSMEILEVI